MLSRQTVLIVSLFFFYGLMLSFFSHRGLPSSMSPGLFMPYLADKPVGEDAFYVLTAAWNLAAKHRLVYNFDQAVTGVQPLITILYSCIAWVTQLFNGDKWTLIRWTIFFNVLNLILLAHILGTIARTLTSNCRYSKSLYATTFTITLFNFGLFSLATYGLETGLYLTFIALCLLSMLRFLEMEKPTLKQAAILGILCGFTGLCRIDFGIILFCLLGFLLLRRRIRLLQAVTIGLFALLIVSPWFVWIHYVSGSWMPSSGVAESVMINAENLRHRLVCVFRALMELSTFWISLRLDNHILLIVFIFFATALIWIMYDSKFIRLLVTSYSIKSECLIGWLIACISILPAYFIFYESVWFYQRYFSPLLIIMLPILAITLNEKIEKKSLNPKLLFFAAIVLFYFSAYLSLHNGKIYHTQTFAAAFIEKKFDKSAKIGVWQSGIIGYFHENVVNLDGKMNFQILRMVDLKELPEYFDKERIDVIVEQNIWIYWILLYSNKDYFAEFWEYYPKEIPDGKTGYLVRKKRVRFE